MSQLHTHTYFFKIATYMESTRQVQDNNINKYN